jgi:hypothetical protein
MLTRFSEFLHRHEPITKLLLRIALLAILGSAAMDFHYLSLDADDIADRFDQMQADISALRSDIENGDDDTPDAPTSFQLAPI